MTDLFEDEFQYIVNGQNRFNSKKNLRNYWCKNKLRQKNLRVVFSDARRQKKSYRCGFTAVFYHPVRMCHTVVTGDMAIYPSAGGKKISKIDERYQKFEQFDPLHSINIFYGYALEPVVDKFRFLVDPIIDLSKSVMKNALTIALWAGISTIVYVNFLHDALPFLSKSQIDTAKTVTPVWFAVAYVIQQAIPFFKKKVDGDLFVKGFTGIKDLEHMAKVMDGADSVHIVSGDFSFIDTNSQLEKRLRNLAFSRKLKLISYKSQAIVEEEMASKTSSNDILLKLKDEGDIFFDFPVKAKITLVKHGGNKKALFRFAKEVHGRSKLHMGFIRETENTAELLDVLENFIENAAAAGRFVNGKMPASSQ